MEANSSASCSLIIFHVILLAATLCFANEEKIGSITKNSTNTANVTELPVTDQVKIAEDACPANSNVKKCLRQFLLHKYDKNVHPVANANDGVEVQVGLALIHVDIDLYTSVMTVDAWMRLSWIDEHLRWDPEKHDQISSLHFGEDELWKPDILLYNSADPVKANSPYGKTHFLVSPNGEVLWVPPAHLKAFCKVNVRLWPFDQQSCKLKFGSWTSHGEQIDLQLYGNASRIETLNFYTSNREWKILDTNAEKKSLKYDCCNESYPDVTFTISLIRDSPGYKSLFVLPCLVIMLMIICTFLLPPTAGEKMVINACAFLASIMYLIYFASNLPFHSTELPIIVMFYSNTVALIGIGLLLNVTCLSMARERKYSPPPAFLKSFFSSSVGKLLCLGHYYHQVSSTHQRLFLELTDMAESEQEQNSASTSEGNNLSIIMKDWILVAAGLERFFFLLYAIIFAIVTSVYI